MTEFCEDTIEMVFHPLGWFLTYTKDILQIIGIHIVSLEHFQEQDKSTSASLTAL